MSKYEFALLQDYLSSNFSIASPDSVQIKKHFSSLEITCYKECVCTYKWTHNQFKFLSLETNYTYSQVMFVSKLKIEHQSPKLQEVIIDACVRAKIGVNQILLQYVSSTPTQIIVQFNIALSLDTLSDILLIRLYHQQLIGGESERIKLAIHNHAFACSSENELRHFIHKKQNIISHLCFQYHHQVTKDESGINQFEAKQVKQEVYKVLLSIMQLIETQYFDYININIEIPHRNFMLNESIDPDRLKKIKDTLLMMPLERNLLKAVYNPIVKLSALTHVDKITYREFLYYVVFVNELYNNIVEYGDSFNESRLVSVLNAINYNHLDVFYYCISIIKHELNREPIISKQINLLYRYLKQYNQTQVSTNLVYNPNLPSTKVQVIKWIEEEINYFQRINNVEGVDTICHTAPEVKKIPLNFSVAQLAYFVRLLVEVKVMDGANQNELLRFMVNHCQTPKTGAISFKSLSSKFYNIEHSTKQSVRDVIIKLLNLANKKD